MEIFYRSYLYLYLVVSVFSFLTLRYANYSERHGSFYTKSMKIWIGGLGNIVSYIFLIFVSIWGDHWYDGLICYCLSFLISTILPLSSLFAAMLSPIVIPVCSILMYVFLFI